MSDDGGGNASLGSGRGYLLKGNTLRGQRGSGHLADPAWVNQRWEEPSVMGLVLHVNRSREGCV